jgi:hypothetical protein
MSMSRYTDRSVVCPKTARSSPQRLARLGWTPLVALCSLLVSGCALRDGGEMLDIEISGNPVDAASLPFIPGVLKSSWLMQGEGGTPWLAVSVPDDILTPTTTERSVTMVEGPLHLYQLIPPYDHYRLDVQFTTLPRSPAGSMCVQRLAKDGTYFLSLLQPGNHQSNSFEVGPLQPKILCGQRTLAYWNDSADNLFLYVLRRDPDGSVVRKDLPWPTEANPKYQQGPIVFSDREEVLFVVDGNYHTRAYYLDSGEIVDLGAMDFGATVDRYYIGVDYDGAVVAYDIHTRKQGRVGYRVSPFGTFLGFDVEHREIITCDWDGVRAVALPAAGQPAPIIAPQRVLDSTPCENRLRRILPRLAGVLSYSPETVVNDQNVVQFYEDRAVPLDGSLPPRIMYRYTADPSPPKMSEGEPDPEEPPAPEPRFTKLQLCQNRATVTTTTPAGMYGLGVSDGWLNGQRFMERGRDVTFAADCGTMYFKEHVANVRRLGTLYAQSVPADPGERAGLPDPLRLSFNVGMIRLLADGRLLASTDLAVLGSQNRLIAIDVATRQARALAWGVSAVTNAWSLGYSYPGRTEVLVEVKDGSVGGLHGLFILDAGPR